VNEGATISRALASLLTKAKAKGCKNPKVFFEAESGSVSVLDGDHPDYLRDGSAPERQRAIILEARITTPFDTGAW
jgi:hypothetical protein